jgi:hypothetical protein
MIEFRNYTKQQKVPNLSQVRDWNIKVQSHAVAGSDSSPRNWAARVAKAAAA